MDEPKSHIDIGRQATLETLEEHGVAYVLIGGAAAQTRGWRGDTEDIDVTPRNDRDNLERLAAALTQLGAPYRVDETRYPDGFDPPGGLDARSFATAPRSRSQPSTATSMSR